MLCPLKVHFKLDGIVNDGEFYDAPLFQESRRFTDGQNAPAGEFGERLLHDVPFLAAEDYNLAGVRKHGIPKTVCFNNQRFSLHDFTFQNTQCIAIDIASDQADGDLPLIFKGIGGPFDKMHEIEDQGGFYLVFHSGVRCRHCLGLEQGKDEGCA